MLIGIVCALVLIAVMATALECERAALLCLSAGLLIACKFPL